MSRSKKAPFITDNSHSAKEKKRAAKAHRRGENVRVLVLLEAYIPIPSKHYVNSYDICDCRFMDAAPKTRRK